MTQSTSGQHFWERLWEKRAIRITISYLLGAWAVIQFVDWMVNRYGVNQVWTDMALVFFILLLPAVLLFAYLQSKENAIQINFMHRLAFPTNFLVAAGAAFYLFSNTSSAQTQSVVVTDEDGKQVERTIPLRSNNKRILVFPILGEPNPKPQKVDWRGFALGKLLEKDLEQNRLFYVYSPYAIQDEIEQYNYSLSEKIPLGIARQIAEDDYTDYFILGNYVNLDPEGMEVNIVLYETKTGKEVSSFKVKQNNLFNVVDDLTEQLNAGIFTEDQLSEQSYIDLPASDLISSSEEGMRFFALGHYFRYIDFQPDQAIKYYEKAVKADTKSALCFMSLGSIQLKKGDFLPAQKNYARALELSANLPERQQLAIKVQNYSVNNELDKMERLLEMWMQIYPDDYFPYTYLLNRYWNAMDQINVERIARLAIENGNYGAVHNTLFYSYLNQGDFAKAEEVLDEFHRLYPVKSTKGTHRANLYKSSGRFEEAMKEYERLNVLQPRNTRIMRSMGYLSVTTGNFDQAIDHASSALRAGRVLQDTTYSYNLMIEAYRRQGKNNQAIDLLQKKLQLETRLYMGPEVYGELFEPLILQMYADNDRLSEIRALLESFKNNYTQDDVIFSCMLDATFALFSDNNNLFKQAVERCDDKLEEIAGNRLFIGLGISALYDGDYPTAVKYLEEYQEKSRIDDDFLTLGYLASAYRLNGQLQEAQGLIAHLLKREPFIGKLRLELAQVYFDQGKVKRAKETLQELLSDQWKDADSEFIPAQKAKNKLAEWEAL